MKEILDFIDHTMALEEKFLPKFPDGTSQHSLLKNRIRALQTARELISGDAVPSREELEFALPQITSILSKTQKARDKYEPGTRNYKCLDPTVQMALKIRDHILAALEEHPCGSQK